LPLEGDIMKRSTDPHNPAPNLSESVQQRLNMYALAAGAAGVSLLALAQPSEGRIVYHAANIRISINNGYNLDLNHDGVTDFALDDFRRTYHPCPRDEKPPFGRYLLKNFLRVAPVGGNGVEGTNNSYAYALTRGMLIGPSQGFLAFPSMARHSYGYIYNPINRGCPKVDRAHGNWVNVTDRYLGLKFFIHGKIHYGWARLSVQIVPGNGIVATLTGYAYETIANKAIVAGRMKGADDPANEDSGPSASLTTPLPDTPQPASLGMLALGAPGVPLWRRKEVSEEGQLVG
jgi:hypothetical protein